MTNTEYMDAIYNIMRSGRGHQAIIDLSRELKTYSDNVDAAVKEYISERQAIRKICNNPNLTQKEKLRAVLAVMGEK